MEDNKTLINRMELEEKIRFLLCSNEKETNTVGSYAFPILTCKKIHEEIEGKYQTIFPSLKMLASSFNLPLIEKSFSCMASEDNAIATNSFYQLNGDVSKANITEDPYYLNKIVTAGLKSYRNFTLPACYFACGATQDTAVDKEIVSLSNDYAIEEGKPSLIVVTASTMMEHYRNSLGFKGLFFGFLEAESNAIDLLNHDVTLVFTGSHDYETTVKEMMDAVALYKVKNFDLKNKVLSLSEFNELIKTNQILDEAKIDAACDRFIDLLIQIHEAPETKTSEFENRDTALEMARESVVLLKNSLNILPFNHQVKIAVLGDYAVDSSYHTHLATPTEMVMPLDAINDYDMNVVGFAHGYSQNALQENNLIEAAVELCESADVAFVYLTTKEKSLPESQLNLLSKLVEKEIRIVAVVDAPDMVDFTFEKYCDALLFVPQGGQAATTAVLDIVSGKINPSGRMAQTVAYENSTAPIMYQNNPTYNLVDPKDVLYPFGYGLSYTSFEFTRMQVNENGVSFNVMNTGEYDGFALAYLYIQKFDTTSTLKNNVLKGFCKVFVQKGNVEKVYIPFDNTTFAYYDCKKKTYGIEGGEYKISICRCANDEVLAGVLRLAKYLKDNTYTAIALPSKIVDEKDALKDFSKTNGKKELKAEEKGLSFKATLVLSIILMIYFDILAIFLAYQNSINTRNIVIYVLLGVLAVFGNVASIIVLVKKGKKVHRISKNEKNKTLTMLIDTLGNYQEIAKEVFPVERKQEVVEEAPLLEEAPQEIEDVVEITEEKEETFEEETYSLENVKNVVQGDFAHYSSINDLYAKLQNYFVKHGLDVGPTTARSVISSLLSSKITFINSDSKDELDEYLKLLCSFLTSNYVEVQASNEWKSLKDLLWQKGENDTKFELSPFASFLLNAKELPESLNICVIKNVDVRTLPNYFTKFLAFCKNPTEEYSILLNDTSITLPKNMCFILVPQEDSYLENMTRGLADISICLDAILRKEVKLEETNPNEETVSQEDVSVSENQEEQVKVEEDSTPVFTAITMTNLKDICYEGKKEFYISEKSWKKIDEFEETIHQSEDFILGNKNVLQMENFSSCFIECGADEMDTLISLFAIKIVPIIKTLDLYKRDNGEKTLSNLVEKIFGDENIAIINKALNKTLQ